MIGVKSNGLLFLVHNFYREGLTVLVRQVYLLAYLQVLAPGSCAISTSKIALGSGRP